MFKKPKNLKGLTVNLVKGLFEQCSRVHIFAFLLNETLRIAFTRYRINFKITNLDLFLQAIFLVTAWPVIFRIKYLNLVYLLKDNMALIIVM